MKRLFPLVAALAFLAPVALAGPVSCSPPSNARIGISTPNEAIFPRVADLLAYRCGSLDCHGSPQRNFVIWSGYGLRLDRDAAPGFSRGGPDTTPAEYDATYRSLVGLEPSVMSQVVQTQGANPDLLTLVRKARGEEEHKGNKVWGAGSPDDLCIAQWLADQSSTAATCKSALGLDLDAGTL